MRGLLLDTHIWYWYLAGSKRLPGGLRGAIDSAGANLWLSAISAWELAVLAERNRIRLDRPVREWVSGALDLRPLEEAPITREVALVSREIDLPHSDPADRFLAATALVFELTLLTVDEHLRKAKWLPTRSR